MERVSELISHDHRWDERALAEQLLPMDADIVGRIPLSHTPQEDFYAWQYKRSGVFSVRSCYRMVMATKARREGWLNEDTESSHTTQEENNWKRLWGVQVPSKLRMFAWRLARASLPTGHERGRRHMTTEVSCPICHAAVDTWRHALLDCNMAKSVWSQWDDEDDYLLPVYGDETDDPKLWLHGLCNALSGDYFVTVLTTLWAIWWARRRAIHEQEFQSPLSTHQFIQRYLSEVRGLPAKNHQHGRPARTPRPRWIPPATGETKINMDGTVAKSSNTGAVGVICRNDQGGFLGASAVVIPGMIDPEVLEAHACREAMALAEDMMVPRVRIASDCVRVVEELKEQVHQGAHCMILNDIQGRMSSFSSCVLIHEYRNSNNEAHNLARMATTLDPGRHVWFDQPPDNLCIPQNIMI
ncbi:hypothetical protein D1007_23159 [Hordeum vulgare]|nr:hypothetical protein D1007_23159 [Hordeum vulgare]